MTLTIMRAVKKFKLLLAFSLSSTVILIMMCHPKLRNRVIYMLFQDPYEDDLTVGNRTLLLTVNHDLGRLGNKMFKYAALLGIAKRAGRRPFVLPYKLDLNMESMFNLSHVEHNTHYNIDSWTTIEETQYAFDDPVFKTLPKRDLKLKGYLQSWKYFQNAEDEIKQEFTFNDSIRTSVDKMLQEFRGKYLDLEDITFVGVHVRRTDELSTKGTCISPKSYFINAFNKMQSLLPDKKVVFVVSGNDLKWCEENLSRNDTIVLKPDAAENHFAVLASCSHFILSVGTFGWWAAWLTGGHVIYYKKFPLPDSYEAIGFHSEDYYPPDWIPVDD